MSTVMLAIADHIESLLPPGWNCVRGFRQSCLCDGPALRALLTFVGPISHSLFVATYNEDGRNLQQCERFELADPDCVDDICAWLRVRHIPLSDTPREG